MPSTLIDLKSIERPGWIWICCVRCIHPCTAYLLSGKCYQGVNHCEYAAKRTSWNATRRAGRASNLICKTDDRSKLSGMLVPQTQKLCFNVTLFGRTHRPCYAGSARPIPPVQPSASAVIAASSQGRRYDSLWKVTTMRQASYLSRALFTFQKAGKAQPKP